MWCDRSPLLWLHDSTYNVLDSCLNCDTSIKIVTDYMKRDPTIHYNPVYYNNHEVRKRRRHANNFKYSGNQFGEDNHGSRRRGILRRYYK